MEHKTGTRVWGFRVGAPVAIGIVFGLVLAVVFGTFVKLLWNWIMPPVLGAGTVTYWQAAGMVLLARMLFGAWGQAPHRGLPPGVEFYAGDRVERRHRRVRYRDWWREEGQTAFEAYAERKKRGEGEHEGEGRP